MREILTDELLNYLGDRYVRLNKSLNGLLIFHSFDNFIENWLNEECFKRKMR